METIMVESENHAEQQLGLIWIDCSYPVVTVALSRILAGKARLHEGERPPTEEAPAAIIYCANGVEGLSSEIARLRDLGIEAPILVFNLTVDLSIASTALRQGAQGFIHAGMLPSQIVRALSVACKGEVVAPRELLEYLIVSDTPVDLDKLTSRQREILDLVVEGMSNAQIAEQLFLSESAIKQHLRGVYRTLGVSNRTEAAKIVQEDGRH
ncbi:hypothetical protein BH23PAT1_BH23PAT1_0610 [soil metagenome]